MQTSVGHIILVNGVFLNVWKPGSGKLTDDFFDIPDWVLHGEGEKERMRGFETRGG